jgi:hypothetical protein
MDHRRNHTAVTAKNEVIDRSFELEPSCIPIDRLCHLRRDRRNHWIGPFLSGVTARCQSYGCSRPSCWVASAALIALKEGGHVSVGPPHC